MITITKTVTKQLTPAEVGRAWVNADDDEQAEFLNAAALEAATWSSPAVTQWHAIGRRMILIDAAKHMLREIVAAMDEE
jgi:protein involved in temperature-dependent protein secretion